MASLKHVTFLSYNVRGINSDTKRLALYKWLESKNCDMYFLQETHCHLRKGEQKWSKEWKGQSVWSKGTTRSKGVTIFFNPRFKYEYTDVVIDTNGRYIKSILTMHEYKYRCINVMPPTMNLNVLNSYLLYQILSLRMIMKDILKPSLGRILTVYKTTHWIVGTAIAVKMLVK